MKKENDKPPDVYPTDPVEMQERVRNIIDRNNKSDRQLAIEYLRQRRWSVRASDAVDCLLRKVSILLRTCPQR